MKYSLALTLVAGTLIACGSNPPAAARVVPTAVAIATQAAAPVPTEPPTIAPATMPLPTIVPTVVAVVPVTQPTAAPETPAARYIAIAQAGVTIPTVRPSSMPKGEWKADVTDNGNGPEVTMTMPVGIGLSTAQMLRQAKRQVAQAVKAIFDADPAVARVSVTGTLPDGAGGAELGVALIYVERAAYARWDGTPDNLGNWRVPDRYR